ncbi:transposase InsO family protein [Paraburkholderia youngii]
MKQLAERMLAAALARQHESEAQMLAATPRAATIASRLTAPQQHHRGRARQPCSRAVTGHRAKAPNQVWSWGTAWMPAAVKREYYYGYMVLDVSSRKIVGHVRSARPRPN